MKSLSILLAGGAMLALSPLALANTTTALVQTGTTTISSVTYNVYALRITTDATWTNQHLTLDLTQGSIYQDSFGGDTQPNPLFFSAAPTLQYDTFFTIPQGYPNTAGVGTSSSIAGNVSPSSTHLFVDWSAPAGSTNVPGVYTVAQLTLTSNAVGSYSGIAYDVPTAGVGVGYSGIIGAAAPEPASLAAFSLGTLALLARRKRKASAS